MKMKATKKILSLVLAVMMVMSTAAMMFIYAEDAPAADTEEITTPKAYADAEDGEKLYDVDFSSDNWQLVDDTKEMYTGNGNQLFLADGTPFDPTQDIDLDGDGKTSGGYAGTDNVRFLNGWLKSTTEGAQIAQGGTLRYYGGKAAVGEEGAADYVPAVPNDCSAADMRYIGQFPAYDLENKTYTMQFDAHWNNARFKFYFANGSFAGFGGCDPYMPNLGLELKTSGYRLMRQSSAITTGVVGKPDAPKAEDGSYSTTFKVVLEGQSIMEDVHMYNGTWTTPKETLNNVVDVVPIKFTIYNVNFNEDTGKSQDIRVATGTIYQPAEVNLVFGIGEYTKLNADQYFELSNLDIYKGDTSKAFKFGFTDVYNTTEWGTVLTNFDARGIDQMQYNFANGYEWTNQGTTVTDEEGIVYINRTDKGATQGAYTNHPFQEEWNQGYYEFELTVNNQGRLKIGLLETTELSRVGFDILPNGNAESFALAQGDKTQYLKSSNAATLWTSGANSFGTGIVENSTTALQGYIKTIVYDTYVADADGDGIPEDPRLVRDYGGNRANIKIAYDCENYIITLYEKITFDQGTEAIEDDVTEWVATCAIDYSVAAAEGKIMNACLDFQAYDANTNATLKNFRVLKGWSVQKLHSWAIGSSESELYTTGFDADLQAVVTENYEQLLGLWGSEWVWSADGATAIESFDALYDAIDPDYYGPTTIKLVPIVTYDELVEGVAVRGVKVAEGENGKYDVTFVGALAGDLAQYNAVGFEIVKVTDINGKFITTTKYVESNEVYETIKANGLDLTAEAVGGDYIFTATLAGEKGAEGINVDYIVTPYTIDVDGVKTVAIDSWTFSFVDGEYAPLG